MISRFEMNCCGAIIEGVLSKSEVKTTLTYCPIPCSNCGKSHGYETFNVLVRNIDTEIMKPLKVLEPLLMEKEPPK